MNDLNLNDFSISPEEEKQDRKSSRKVLWGCFTGFFVLILAVVLAYGGLLWKVNDTYKKEVDVVSLRPKGSDGSSDTQVGKGKGTNILLIGSDKRNPEEAAESGITGQRGDVLMWMHIAEDGQSAFVSSFPRDLYVDIPGHGKGRINSALAHGGVPLQVQTVENYVGSQIDHAALVDFDGLKGVVDSLGGVDVWVPVDFKTQGMTFTKGKMHMDGTQALAFARERKSFANGDFQRNLHQRRLLAALSVKVLANNTLANPQQLLALTEALSPYLTVDDGLTSTKLVELGLQFKGIEASDVEYLSVPHGEPMTTKAGASVVATDEEGMAEFREAIKNDTMKDYVSKHQ